MNLEIWFGFDKVPASDNTSEWAQNPGYWQSSKYKSEEMNVLQKNLRRAYVTKPPRCSSVPSCPPPFALSPCWSHDLYILYKRSVLWRESVKFIMCEYSDFPGFEHQTKLLGARLYHFRGNLGAILYHFSLLSRAIRHWGGFRAILGDWQVANLGENDQNIRK